ncbi:hypothetical protein D3C87_1570310 [compost metagenome]
MPQWLMPDDSSLCYQFPREDGAGGSGVFRSHIDDWCRRDRRQLFQNSLKAFAAIHVAAGDPSHMHGRGPFGWPGVQASGFQVLGLACYGGFGGGFGGKFGGKTGNQ